MLTHFFHLFLYVILSFQVVKHERRTCLRTGERKQNCDGSVQYCELRLRVGYRWAIFTMIDRRKKLISKRHMVIERKWKG